MHARKHVPTPRVKLYFSLTVYLSLFISSKYPVYCLYLRKDVRPIQNDNYNNSNNEISIIAIYYYNIIDNM